jgi:hypothetical protein
VAAAGKRPQRSRPASDDAEILCRTIHTLGDDGLVSVRAGRGHLTVHLADGLPIARATPLGAGQFGLSFHTHTGRWEPMPMIAELPQLAHDLVGLLGPTSNGGTFPTGLVGRTTSLA